MVCSVVSTSTRRPRARAVSEVTGPIEATLYAATSARDTDWFVRLVDVQPDGRALFLAEGAIRARMNQQVMSQILPALSRQAIRTFLFSSKNNVPAG